MKFTLSWLKEHLDTKASLEELCDKLTAIGLEIENIEDRAKALAPFIIAEVLTADKHPNADKLQLLTVTTGKEKLQVVCGAPNARAGLKGVLARPGDVIPREGEALKLTKIRGVESQGMMCSADELKLGEDSKGIIELPADAPVGENYAKYAGLGDPVIEINLTPNRADCAGVRGVARDLAAAGMGKLITKEIKPVKGAEPSKIKVKLEFSTEPKACPLFVGRTIRNIKNGPSPEWLQRRLRAIGLRPISALVDITNLLTMDAARPLHVFDADKVKGDLWVRPAKGGEKLDALNDKTYTLEAGMTAIGDDTGLLSIAGIVGGVSSGCDEKTTNVFLESAYFDPATIAKTGRALQIVSDARYRFERGIDPAFTIPGAELATQLIVELCGTKDTVVSELYIAGEVPHVGVTVNYDPKKCLRHAGIDVPVEEQIAILTTLGFKIENSGAKLKVTAPSWRGDVHGDVDLVEEITRIKGFDHITPVSMPRTHVVTATAVDRLDQRASKARRAMAAQGLMEAVTWSFMPSAIAAVFGQNNPSLRLSNPISADLDVMRPSILGNLVLAAKRNADRGFADVGLFEVGPAYRDTSPEGQDMIACAMRAGTMPRHWAVKQRAVDAFDAKADAFAALAACGAPVASVQVLADAPAWYHPGRSGSLRLGATLLGYFGELHPALIEACGAEGPMVGCELFLAAIPEPRSNGTARPLLKLEALQPVLRDFAFVVANDVTAEKMIKAVKGADKNLIRDVSVFDVYEGKGIEPGKKSVALSVTLQPVDQTLTDRELEDIAARITAAVTKATGAVLRG